MVPWQKKQPRDEKAIDNIAATTGRTRTTRGNKRRNSRRKVGSPKRDLKKLHQTPNNHRHDHVFEQLSSISTFLERRSKEDAENTPEATIRYLLKQDDLWLDAVSEELLSVVPTGCMTVPIWTLIQALMRCLSEQGGDHAGSLVVDLLYRLLKEEDCFSSSSPKKNRRVTAVVYNLAMRSSPHSAESLFYLMQDRYEANPSCRSKPTISTKVSFIMGLAKAGKVKEAQTYLWPNAPITLFNTIMQLNPEPHEAEGILLSLEANLQFPDENWKKNRHDDDDSNNSSSKPLPTKPNVASFRIVLQKWLDVNSGRAQAVMRRLLFWSQQDHVVNLQPCPACFMDVIKATVTIPKALDMWLNQFQKSIQENNLANNGDCEEIDRLLNEAFDLQFQAWCRTRGCSMKLRSILDNMSASDNNPPPPMKYWIILLNEQIKERKLMDAENTLCQPRLSFDVVHYNLVLQAWCKSARVDKAQTLLDWMSKNGIKPNNSSYQILVKAWEKIDGGKTKRNISSLQLQGNDHQGEQVKQNNSVVVKKHDEPPSPMMLRLMGELFQSMKDQFVVPTVASFDCCVMGQYLPAEIARVMRSSHGPSKSVKIFPDAGSCNSVLAVCLSNPTPKASEIATGMLKRMVNAYVSGDKSMLLDPSYFTRLYTRLYREREYISVRAVKDMVSAVAFPDDAFAYSSLKYALTVCAIGRDNETPQYAKYIWHSVKEPSLELLNLALKSFRNHPRHPISQQTAPKLLEEVSSKGMISPNGESFRLVIETVAKSKQPNAPQASFYLIQRYGSQVTSESLTHVLYACAVSPTLGGDGQAKFQRYDLALRAFNQWRSNNGCVTCHHFLMLLTCAIRHAPNPASRNKMILAVLKLCISYGMVDEKIWKRAWNLAAKYLQAQLIDSYDVYIPYSALPPSWSRNVVQTTRRKSPGRSMI